MRIGGGYLQSVFCKTAVLLCTVYTTRCDGRQKRQSSSCSINDENAIARCADPLYDIGAFREDGTGPDGLTWEFFAERGQHYMDTMCKAFFRFELCADPYRESCFEQEPVKSRYQTATEILNLICRDGYKDMTESFDCLVAAMTRSEMIHCQRQMMSQTQQLAEQSHYDQQVHACSLMQHYLSCVQYPIRYACGGRAWNIVQQIIARPASLVMPQCPLMSDGTTASSTRYTVFITAAALLLLTLWLRY